MVYSMPIVLSLNMLGCPLLVDIVQMLFYLHLVYNTQELPNREVFEKYFILTQYAETSY